MGWSLRRGDMGLVWQRLSSVTPMLWGVVIVSMVHVCLETEVDDVDDNYCIYYLIPAVVVVLMTVPTVWRMFSSRDSRAVLSHWVNRRTYGRKQRCAMSRGG